MDGLITCFDVQVTYPHSGMMLIQVAVIQDGCTELQSLSIYQQEPGLISGITSLLTLVVAGLPAGTVKRHSTPSVSF